MDFFLNFLLFFAGAIAVILNIMLFFKIWGMTDNVKLLEARVAVIQQCNLEKQKMPDGENRFIKAQAQWIRGNKDAAKQILDDMFYENLADIFDLENSFEDEYNSLIARYSRIYQKMGLPEPDYAAFNRQ
ncbi:MAG: hypothetical protein ACTTKI_00425 [Tannerella sp.]|uniref:hypothetical protein n=1 Tax=Tannerella sp. TaxID=2382127 RepID=UPI003FA2E55B